jgi:hypothetical protein
MKAIAKCLIIPACVWLASVMPGASETGDFEVRPAGFEVRLAAPGGSDRVNAFVNSRGAGTVLGILVVSQDRLIAGIEPENSRITKVTDDTGKELLDTEENKPGKFWGFPHVSKDARALLLMSNTLLPPAPEARQIQVEGHILVGVAEKLTEETHEIPLEKGSSWSQDGLTYTIQKIEHERDQPKTVTRVSYRLEGPLEKRRQLLFLDQTGVPLDHGHNAEDVSHYLWKGSRDDDAEDFVSFRGTPPEPAIVQVQTWPSLQEREIPFLINYRLGLPEARPKTSGEE